MAAVVKPFRPLGMDPSTADDPLSQALQPPPDESPDDRALRIQRQQEAQRVSSEIDESIQESKKAFDRRKKAIKILLLGKSYHAFSRLCSVRRPSRPRTS